MKRYLLLTFLFLTGLVGAQQISFQQNYAKGENAYITTFKELQSLDIVLTYTLIKLDISHTLPHSLELHLMKVDKNGTEIWDHIIRTDTTRFAADRFCTQSIEEGADGSLALDITYPYGEKYLLIFDAAGNQKRETYLHNSFGDYNIYSQLMKQRGKNIALADGSVLSVGASFTTTNPKATITTVAPGGGLSFDYGYFRGYFNDAYYLNYEHLYTIGVEQTDTNETLVLSDLRSDGGVNYHIKKAHHRNEKILATTLYFNNRNIRVAESISQKDTAFHVTIYDYTLSGMLLSSTTYKVNCGVMSLSLNTLENTWLLGNKCKSDESQTIEKMDLYAHFAFSFSDSFDSVRMLKKLHDGNYLFCFSKGSGIHLWKLNAKGTLQTGPAAEGFFAPNPAIDKVTFIGSKETFNHAVNVKLFDMTGNTLRLCNFESWEPITLSLSGLREGIYVYTILTSDGVELRGKIVVYQKG